jgi:ABC-type dipeptide/oligopeptide/nickel transport system permease component
VGRFLLRRLLFTVFVLFIVSLITFVIFVKLPASDPARRATGRATTEANIEAAREAFDLNRPVYVQYGRGVLHRDREPVRRHRVRVCRPPCAVLLVGRSALG